MRKARHILMVDDDDDDRLIFSQILWEIDEHIEFTSVEDGKKAVDLLKAGLKPDVILLDVNMPRMNGYECLESIRSNHMTSNLPVMMMSTSNKAKELEQQAFFYQKPNTKAELKLVLLEILNRISNNNVVVS